MDNPTDDNVDLALRSQSVRTLTDPELSRANGGRGNNTAGSCLGSACGTNQTNTKTK